LLYYAGTVYFLRHEVRLRAKKHLGQNFLINPHYIEKLAASIHVAPGVPILEIGPGKGAITSLLAQKTDALFAVEKDHEAVAYLRQTLASHRNITLIEADVLKFDLASIAVPETLMVAVGNLPYNIASPIMLKILRNNRFFSAGYFMLQREVGDRLLARPRTKEYSFLTVAINTFARVHRLHLVPPGVFSPVPKVRSVFMHLAIRKETRLADSDIDNYFSLVTTAFSQRRKKVINTLCHRYHEDKVRQFFSEGRIHDTARAEELSVDEYLGLFKAVS